MPLKKINKMKQYLIILFLGLIPIANYGQSQDSTRRFGFAINSSFNGELYPVRIVPSAIYIKRNNQLELGVGFNPANRETQKLLSGEFNYKYFPNGHGKKYNMFFITRISYVNSARDTYYPTTYKYLFVNGGYGFEVIPFKNVFLGTNVSFGAFTNSKKSEIPYDAFQSQKMFDKIGLNLAFQFNLGYRF